MSGPRTSDEAIAVLAEEMHNLSETCNANYYLPFAECGARDADLAEAEHVLTALRERGWEMTRPAQDRMDHYTERGGVND